MSKKALVCETKTLLLNHILVHGFAYSVQLQRLIGQLHDDVILLQLPESLSLLFFCAN